MMSAGTDKRVFGLLGKSLQHSFSPGYFSDKFEREGIEDCEYRLFELEKAEDFKSIPERVPMLSGLNVTIPFKESIIPYLDDMDLFARSIGAVNTLLPMGDGRWKGFNTDWIGFVRSLKPFLEEHHRKALILGTGGSSKAIAFALSRLGIEVKFVSRDPSEDELFYTQLDERLMKAYSLVINTTPLGMYPDESNCPDIPYELIGSGHLLFDLIYNPEETRFMKTGIEQGAKVSNGLEMLKFQAEASWQIWNRS
jgi:shikimate dehydrogenase